MSELSPLDAARFAFRKRDVRFVLTKAAVAYIVLTTIVGAAALALSWPAVDDLAAWYMDVLGATSSGGDPPLPPTEALMTLAPAGLVSGLVSWILLAAFEAACLRWLVRGEQGGGIWGLSAGADTWRVFGIYWVWLGLGVLLTLVIALFYVALRSLAGLHPVAQIVAMLVGVLAPLGIVALMILFAVRLSPAAAHSVAQRKFSFFGAWSITRGKFWNLLGAFVIVAVAYLVATTIVGGVLRIPFDQATAPIMVDVMSGADSGMSVVQRLSETLLTPAFLALAVVYVVASRIMAILSAIAWIGVNASVARTDEAA